MTRGVSIPDDWTGEQALTVTSFLEALTDAIWRAHGQAMAWTLDPPEREPEPEPASASGPRTAPARHATHEPEDDLPF